MNFNRFECKLFVHFLKWIPLLLISFISFGQVDVGFDGGEGTVLRVLAHPSRYTFFFEQFDELELGPNEEILKLVVQPKSIKFYDNPKLEGEPIATIDKHAIKLDGKVVYPSHRVAWGCEGCYYRYFYGSSYRGKEAEVPYLYIRQGDITGAFVQYIYADEFKNGVAKVSKFNKFNSIDEVVDIPLKRDFYFRPSDVSKFYYFPPGDVLRDRFLKKHPVISDMYQSLKECTDKKSLECIKKVCSLSIHSHEIGELNKLDESKLLPGVIKLLNLDKTLPIYYDFQDTDVRGVKGQALRAEIVTLSSKLVKVSIFNEGDKKQCFLSFGDDYSL